MTILRKALADVLVAALIGFALFGVLVLLHAEGAVLVYLPVGVAIVWFLSQWMRRRKTRPE